MARWTEADIPDLSGRHALVTGAASGLGFETARALAGRGALVTLVDRNAEGGQAAAQRIGVQVPGSQVEFRALDLGDLAAIRRFAQGYCGTGAALDILVNNAGILPSLQRRTTRDGFELAFGIGHLGHFALTGLLLAALLRSPAPRVVSTTSLVQAYAQIDFDDLQAERSYEPQRAYNQTKLATLMFALDLQQRAGTRLQSLAAHPGVARTPLGDARMLEPPRRWRDRAERWAYQAMMRWFGQPAERGALPILYASAAPNAVGGAFYGPDGFQQFSGYPARVAPSKAALDPAQRHRLWAISEDLTGVRYDLAG